MAAINRRNFGVTTNLALETGGVLGGDEIGRDIDVSLIRSQVAAVGSAHAEIDTLDS